MICYSLLSILLIYSVVSSYFCLKFAMTVLRVQDSLEASLEVIDQKYESISEILKRPLFFDSPEVRQVLKDIEETRDSLELVARDLSNKMKNEEEEEDISNEG